MFIVDTDIINSFGKRILHFVPRNFNFSVIQDEFYFDRTATTSILFLATPCNLSTWSKPFTRLTIYYSLLCYNNMVRGFLQ